jgi:peptide deformylase
MNRNFFIRTIILFFQLFRQGGFLKALALILALKFFLPPTDPRLNEPADQVCPCQIRTKKKQALIDVMFQIVQGEIEGLEQENFLGLSAPQIGVFKRIILVDLANPNSPTPIFKEFINPVILWQSEETNLSLENCPSEPQSGTVSRAHKILIQGYNRHGEIFTEELSGRAAHIAQHEIDHLDGIRLSDRTEP